MLSEIVQLQVALTTRVTVAVRPSVHEKSLGETWTFRNIDAFLKTSDASLGSGSPWWENLREAFTPVVLDPYLPIRAEYLR